MAVERRIVTILFADLVDFTPLSERLDAEDVAAIQDAYFAVARETIGRYGGSLEKFIGDAVMAAFGLGHARDDDAERAIRAALALVNGVASLGARLGLDAAELRVRVGVNTGEAVVTAGAPAEGAGTQSGRVTGDIVNVAARLQAAAPPGSVIVGEATALAVAAAVDLEEAQPVVLKGKAAPVPAAVVRGIRPEPSRALAMGGMVAPTIGRDAELARLVAALDGAAGSSRRVLLVAPPGVGKTRLVGELVGAASDVPWWRTRCRQEAGTPFALVRDVLAAGIEAEGLAAAGPMAEAVRRLVEGVGASTARATVVASAVDDLLRDPDGPAGSPTEAATAAPGGSRPDRDGLFAAWAEALRALARPAGVRWLVEDLHWATPDEIAFVERVAGDPPGGGVAVVATARPSIVDRVDGGWQRIDLEPLPGADAEGLVRALVGDALPDALVARVAARSDGNPLFIEELLRTWVSVGTLRRDGPDAPWRLATPADDVPLPTTIQAIYASQLDDLPAAARTTARRASVAGRRFPAGALDGLEVGDRDASLGELARRAIIAGPAAEAPLGDMYTYRHALVRDAAYATLARAERADLHLRLARWLEAAAGSRADSVARAIGDHYADALANAPAIAPLVGGPAGLPREDVAALAASWLERAGVEALRLAAHEAAREALTRALDLTPASDTVATARRHELVGDSLIGTGSLDEASAAYQRAVDATRAALADGAADAAAHALRRALARAGRSLGLVRWEQARFADMLTLARDLLAEFPADDPDARLPLELVEVQGRMGLTNDASLADEAAAIRVRAAALGDELLELDALRLEVSTRGEAGLTTPDDWRDLAARLEAVGRMRDAVGMLINVASTSSDDRVFEDLARRIDALADAHHLTESRGWIAHVRALRAFDRGAWDEASEQARDAIAIATAHGYHRIVVRTWFVLRPIATARGDAAALVAAADWFAARDREAAFPDSPYGRMMRLAFDLDAAAAGGPQRSLPEYAWIDGAFGLPYDGGDWLAAIERVVVALLEAGRVDDAEQAVRRLASSVDASDRLAAASRVLLDAWLRERRDDPDVIAVARDGVRVAREAGAPWWELRLLEIVARAGAATEDEATRAAALAARLGIGRDAS